MKFNNQHHLIETTIKSPWAPKYTRGGLWHEATDEPTSNKRGCFACISQDAVGNSEGKRKCRGDIREDGEDRVVNETEDASRQ